MKITHVAAAVFLRPDGTFLLAQRPEGKPYPGYWEFPGGKVEPGETPYDCLKREIKEELDVEVLDATPWIVRVHTYTHATVRLNFFRVTAWCGEFKGMEGQAYRWQDVHELDVGPMLPANTPVFRALAVPSWVAVSDVAAKGLSEYSQRLDAALKRGLRWLVLREPDLSGGALGEAAGVLTAQMHAAGGCLILSSRHASNLAGSDGIHLTARDLMAATTRPEGLIITASCHTRAEIEHAAALGVDAALVGPVLPTASHPGSAVLGWDGFAELMRDPPLPVLALGGLASTDLSRAQLLGAQGIAMQRAL
jgi:8-oxo-dGTP diphosphatase